MCISYVPWVLHGFIRFAGCILLPIVPISGKHRKYLKFRWKGVLYHYTCLPNGLCSAPRFFTKLFKPVLSHLRAQGFTSSIYLDDLFLQGDTECTNNVHKTVALLTDLGFTKKNQISSRNKF